MKSFKKFVGDNKAATAIEYGLIAALIAIGLITVLGLLGDELGTTFGKAKDSLVEANADAT